MTQEQKSLNPKHDSKPLATTEKAIVTLLASPDCLHPKLPLIDKTEQSYLTQLSAALAKDEFDEAAYGQLFTRLEAGSLSLAALYRFANLCYQHWQQQWPTAEILQTQQAETARLTAQLQTMAQGRTLFRRSGTPTRYYWGQANSQTDGTVEKGLFFTCYPTFAIQGEGMKAIYQAELITDASHLTVCEAYTQTQRQQQSMAQLHQHSGVLHQHLQQQDEHAKLIVNLQLAWLYYRSGRVISSLSIHETGQAVFYFRQTMGQIARHAFTQQQPPSPADLTTAARQLRGLIDQALLDQAQQALFASQSAVLLARWSLCYQEPALDAIYQLSQQTHTLLTHAVSVPLAAKQPLLDIWLSGFNRSLAGEDEQEVRVAMRSAVTRACNPVQKYPHSLATVHQWLLAITQQLQQHGETGRARALLHAYQQLLIRKRPNLQQTIASTDQDKAPYITILATCEQALTELDQWLTDSNAVADSKATIPQGVSASAFATRNEQTQTWRQTLVQFFASNTKAGDIYTANTQFARDLLTDICAEIEQQIGKAPCAYTLLGAGSFSRGEISPASDLDCALLVAEDAAKTHPWFRCFLQLLQWKLASLPAGVLSLESETLAWISKGYWFDTPAGFIEQHLASQQPNNPSSYQQPENFGAQWFRWIYSSGNQPQEKDALFSDYQQRLQTFFQNPIGTSSQPAYQQLAPWSLKQHVGQAITPSRRQLSLSSAPVDATAKEAKESKHEVKASSQPASTTNTFTILNVKNLSYRLINAILCYGRFYNVPSGITTTREVLAYLKNRRCLPSAFIARLEIALDPLYTWRLRQHWSWLHHASELGENEVVLWPEDATQQAAIQALPANWRGFYLDKAETEQCWAILNHTAEVIGRNVEGFATFASRTPATLITESIPNRDAVVSHRANLVGEAKREIDNSTWTASSYTTTTAPEVKETKEAKREVSEEEAQAIMASPSRAVAESKDPVLPSTTQLFNPLAAAVEWTLQQLAKPNDSKLSSQADDKLRTEHVIWLAQVMGRCVQELPVGESQNNDPTRAKQDPLFRKHWQMYWKKIPVTWRGFYITQLCQSADTAGADIIEALTHAPNQVGWRLSTQIREQQWQSAFHTLFATSPQYHLPAEAKADIAQGKAIWVSWGEQETIRWAPLRQEHTDRLLDSKHQQWKLRHNNSGNHRLYQLQTAQEHFWLKLYPEQPGTEYLVTALDRRLGVNGIPPHQLLALHHAPFKVSDGTLQGTSIEQSAALLIPHIASSKQNLHHISKQHPEQLDQLDFISFAKTLLRVLLTNPEDDKGGDYFLLPIAGSDKQQLTRIDNERAFLPITYLTGGKRTREELQVKSILYCLDQMLLPWSSDPRTAALLEDLHQLQPSALILDLLHDIERQQHRWQQLFPEAVVKQHANLQDPWMSLPIFLLPQGLEGALLKRLTSLQTALRLLKPQAITGLKLLELMQPKLARYYNQSLFQGKLARNPQHPQANVWARFDQVAGRYYRQSATTAASVDTMDNQVSVQSGPAIYSRQLSLALPQLPKTNAERHALAAFAYSVWSQQTHSIKQALQAARNWQHLQAIQVSKGLLALQPEAQIQFGWLSAREQQQILEQLLSKSSAPLTLQQQQCLLTALAGAQCHNLNLRPFASVLTNALLTPILAESGQQLLRLDISDCTLLKADILDAITKYCKHLKHLIANGQSHWTSISLGDLEALTRFECNHATALTKLKFGRLPALKYLSLQQAAQLTALADRGLNVTAKTKAWRLPSLQQLDISGCLRLSTVKLWVDRPQHLSIQAAGCGNHLQLPQIQSQQPANNYLASFIALKHLQSVAADNFLYELFLATVPHLFLTHGDGEGTLTRFDIYEAFFNQQIEQAVRQLSQFTAVTEQTLRRELRQTVLLLALSFYAHNTTEVVFAAAVERPQLYKVWETVLKSGTTSEATHYVSHLPTLLQLVDVAMINVYRFKDGMYYQYLLVAALWELPQADLLFRKTVMSFLKCRPATDLKDTFTFLYGELNPQGSEIFSARHSALCQFLFERLVHSLREPGATQADSTAAGILSLCQEDLSHISCLLAGCEQTHLPQDTSSQQANNCLASRYVKWYVQQLTKDQSTREFLLTSLPQLRNELRNNSKKKFTSFFFYLTFVDQLLERARHSPNLKIDSVAKLASASFPNEPKRTALLLAMSMYAHRTQRVTFHVTPHTTSKAYTVWQAVLKSAASNKITAYAADALFPLLLSGPSGELQFRQTSSYDDLMAVALVETPSADSLFQAAVLDFFNQQPIHSESGIIGTLVEWSREPDEQLKARYTAFRDFLFELVARSAREPQWAQASSNAATILNACQEDLSYRSWAGVQLPGADLSYGVLAHSDLSGANLEGVKLAYTILYQANLEGANLNNVKWSEFPQLEVSRGIYAFTRHPTQPWVAVALAGEHEERNEVIQLHLDTGELVGKPLTGHTDMIFSLAYSPDGRRLAAAGGYRADSPVWQWDTESAQFIGRLDGLMMEVRCAVYSPDGRCIVAADSCGCISRWDAQTGRPKGEALFVHSGEVASLAYSPDSSRFASAGEDKAIRQWDAQTGQPIGEPLTGHTDGISSIAYSPNGGQLASGSWDGTVRLWDAQTGKPIGVPLIGHTKPIYCIAYSADGQRLAAGSNKEIRQWNTQMGKPIGIPLVGSDIRDVAYSADGQRLIARDGRKIRQWDTHYETLALIPNQRSLEVSGMAFSPDVRQLVTGDGRWTGDRGVLQLWDTETGQPISPALNGHTQGIGNVNYSLDGHCIISTDWKSIRRWDAQTGALTSTLLHELGNVAISPDGHRFVSSGGSAVIRQWEIVTDHPVGEPSIGHTEKVTTIVYSPDGHRFASGGEDKTIRQWDAATGAAIGKPLIGHKNRIDCVVYSPDGRRLASTECYGGEIRQWDAETGEPIGTPFTGHEREIAGIAYSPDSRRIISAGYNMTVKVWHAESQHCLAVLQWQQPITIIAATAAPSINKADVADSKSTPPPRSAKLKPTEDLLAIGDNVGTLSLWAVSRENPEAGFRLIHLPKHTGMPLLAHGALLKNCRMSSLSKRLLAQHGGAVSEVIVSDADILVESKTSQPAATSQTTLSSSSSATFFQPAPHSRPVETKEAKQELNSTSASQTPARLAAVQALIDTIYPADDSSHAGKRTGYLGQLIVFQQHAKLTPKELNVLEAIEKELQAEQEALISSLH